MAEPPTVELSRGFSHPRELVGRTLILRPRHDVGFPLVVGIFSALIAVALGFVVAVTTHSLGINVLVAIELALAIGIGWFALLIEILERLHDHPIGFWIRRSTILAGLLLVAFGVYFLARAITQH